MKSTHRRLCDELQEVIAHFEPSDHFLVRGELLRRVIEKLESRSVAATETGRRGGLARAQSLPAERKREIGAMGAAARVRNFTAKRRT